MFLSRIHLDLPSVRWLPRVSRSENSCSGLIATLSMLLAVSVLCSAPLNAAPISLFEASVEVEGDTSAERRRAAPIALRQVLIKASGDMRVFERYPSLREALATASNLMASYQIDQRVVIPEAGLADTVNAPELRSEQYQQLITIGFEPTAIRQLLRRAGAPFWQLPRQGAIVWLAWQRDGQREIVGVDQLPNMVELINREAEQRGLPIVHPLLDLAERQRIDVDDIWSSDLRKLEAASEAYDKGAILFGKVAQTYDQRYLGEWSSVVNGRVTSTQAIEVESAADFVAAGINLVTEQLADLYAARGGIGVEGDEKVLIIDSVDSVEAYQSLMTLLENINAIDQLTLKQVEQSQLRFHFKSVATIDKIANLLSLNEHLQLLENFTSGDFDTLRVGDKQNNTLHYRWQDR